MPPSDKAAPIPGPAFAWRTGLLLLIVAGSLAFMLSRPPFGQNVAYHDFADGRAILGVPNFFDVMSNLPFLLVGVAGLGVCRKARVPELRPAWLTFFTGVALVSAGSAWYHLDPNNETLVWDRLPMTIGFMGLFVALLAEYVSVRLGRILLVPALLLGFSSVLYWHWRDDLRFYFWIQSLPLLTIPVVMALFRAKYSHQWLFPAALGCYLLAKVSEAYDRKLFVLSGDRFSGHSLKHLLAAAGCLCVVVMLRKRRRVGDEPTA